MKVKEALSLKNISLWSLSLLLGGALIDWSLRNANAYSPGIGTIFTFIIFAFVLGTSGPYPIWILLYNKIQESQRIEARLIVFRINNSFSKWSEDFDNSFTTINSYEVTPIFRGVSKEDPKKVIAVIQGNSSGIDKFIRNNNCSLPISNNISEDTKISIYLPYG